jgi:hypothetical protein
MLLKETVCWLSSGAKSDLIDRRNNVSKRITRARNITLSEGGEFAVKKKARIRLLIIMN